MIKQKRKPVHLIMGRGSQKPSVTMPLIEYTTKLENYTKKLENYIKELEEQIEKYKDNIKSRCAHIHYVSKNPHQGSASQAVPCYEQVNCSACRCTNELIKWHDLQDDPDDLPVTDKTQDAWKEVLGNDGHLYFYDMDCNEWCILTSCGWKNIEGPIAWTEVPTRR